MRGYVSSPESCEGKSGKKRLGTADVKKCRRSDCVASVRQGYKQWRVPQPSKSFLYANNQMARTGTCQQRILTREQRAMFNIFFPVVLLWHTSSKFKSGRQKTCQIFLTMDLSWEPASWNRSYTIPPSHLLQRARQCNEDTKMFSVALECWSCEREFHMMKQIHQNKGDSKPWGKSTLVVFLSKHGDHFSGWCIWM